MRNLFIFAVCGDILVVDNSICLSVVYTIDLSGFFVYLDEVLKGVERYISLKESECGSRETFLLTPFWVYREKSPSRRTMFSASRDALSTPMPTIIFGIEKAFLDAFFCDEKTLNSYKNNAFIQVKFGSLLWALISIMSIGGSKWEFMSISIDYEHWRVWAGVYEH